MAFLLMHASRRIMHSFEYVFPSFPHTGLAIRGHGMLHSNETSIVRSSHSKMFLRKGVLKIYSKLTGEHPCRSAISIKLQSRNASGRLLLKFWHQRKIFPLKFLWIFCDIYTARKMKFSIKDFFSKCDQIRSFLRIWSHLLKESLT